MRLIDADALIKQIEKNICEPCKKRKEDYNGVRCRACQYGDEIGDINDAPTVVEWIPVEERLPETCKPIMVTTKCSQTDYEVSIGEYWDNQAWK